MSSLPILAPALLNTVLSHLALLFLAGAGGDQAAARQAASDLLTAYNVETAAELHLATDVIAFGFQALEALSQAASPEMTLAKTLRLRGSAVSLSREAHKAQRKLDMLQRDRRSGAPSSPAETDVTQDTTCPNPAIAAAPTATRRGKTWTQSYQQRQSAKRIAANLKKNQESHLITARSVTSAQPAMPAA